MAIDDKALHELMVESQDLQGDALRDMKGQLGDLAEIREARRSEVVEPDEVRHFNEERRRALSNGGLGMGAIASAGLLATAFGGALVGISATPASADQALDIQILQTAASLENLAVATYGAALTLPFISSNKIVAAFATMTMKQHKEHGAAFNAQAKQLGGKEQTATNPKYTPVVTQTKPMLTDAMKVVTLATTLETVATETYVANISLLSGMDTKAIFASIMGVEAQHLATLRAVGALLAGGAPELIAIPTNVAKLPAAAGSVAFPKPFEGTEMASPPQEGAVQ